MGARDDLAKGPVSLTFASYDESLSEPTENGERRTGSY